MTEEAKVKPEQQEDPLTKQRRIAKELFGNDFHDEEYIEPESSDGTLTVEEAYNQRREARDNAESLADEVEDIAEEEGTTNSEGYSELQESVEQFDKDLELFNKLKAQGIKALSGGDKRKEAAIKADLDKAEKELMQRRDAILEIARDLHVENTSAKVQKEKAKLKKAMPDFDSKAVRTYLKSQGFDDNAIDSETDSRLLIMAEKARRYDKQNGPKSKVIPKKVATNKGNRKTAKIIKLEQRFNDTRSLDDLWELQKAQRESK